jgi:hypothetical protein
VIYVFNHCIGNRFIQEVVFFKVEKKEGIIFKEIGYIYPHYEKLRKARWQIMAKYQFKYKDDGLSEEHIKQICRFLDTPYVKGYYQKWHKFSQFKFWHKREMHKRDKGLKIFKLK